jgi:site-specific recombinase XerD
MINNGSDLSVVSTVLGHDSPQTTLQYLSSNIEKLRECALSIAEFPITHKLYGHENN